MIESIHELSQKAAIRSVSVTVHSSNDSNVTVVIAPIFHDAPATPTTEQNQLRQALSSPLVVSGHAGEVDAQIESIVDEYIENISVASDGLVTNSDKIKEKVSAAKREVGAEETREDDIESSNSSDQDNTAVDNEDDSTLDDFANGEADSL